MMAMGGLVFVKVAAVRIFGGHFRLNRWSKGIPGEECLDTTAVFNSGVREGGFGVLSRFAGGGLTAVERLGIFELLEVALCEFNKAVYVSGEPVGM